MARSDQRRFWTGAAIWLAGLSAAPAATVCYNEVCGGCPTFPGAVFSTLISSFPTGAETPIVFVDPADNLQHRFVATQEGIILVWNGATQQLLPTPFLDLSPTGLNKVRTGGEEGLLGFAVEPDYLATGRFYVYYSRLADGDIVVERYQRSTLDPDVADPAGATILRVNHTDTNHKGGNLAFGPDGYLYISTGDGGGGCDGDAGINGDGQNRTTLLGKMMRIDVRGVDPTPVADDCGLDANYTIPSDNPYVLPADTDCDEIWILGLRNPFRFSFDRATGDLYIGDVGQNKWEEISLKRASTPALDFNLGWPCREACETSANGESGCGIPGCPTDTNIEMSCAFPRDTGFTDPILCHHNGGWGSIMGGYRYRGSFVPAVAGAYLYGDNACGEIWRTTTLDPANPGAVAATCLEDGFNGLYGFAEDQLGELYLARGWNGTVDCLHDGGGCRWARFAGLFEDGFESQDTSRWSATVP